MKAIEFISKEEGISFNTHFSDPVKKEGEAIIRLTAAALNHRDVWITKGMYPGIQSNIVLGSDGVGVYQKKRVLINPNVNWGDRETHPAPNYSILGMPVNGTFAEQINVPKDRIYEAPAHLSDEEAAALPLAGLTAYRALFSRGQLLKGERVFVNGVGGGVALFATQFALAAGAEVYVSSGSDEKIKKAISLGVKAGVNYKTADWKATTKEMGSSFDLIIDSAGGEGFGNLLKLAAPGGRIVIYGGTLGTIPKVSPQLVFWKQLSILGTSMGSDRDFVKMLSFVKEHEIKPLVDRVYPIQNAKDALQRMSDGKQFGKIVLSIK